jgi:hypothetical protein
MWIRLCWRSIHPFIDQIHHFWVLLKPKVCSWGLFFFVQIHDSTFETNKKWLDSSISFLAGGLEHFLCFHILGIIWNHHPNSLIFFRGGGQPPTRYLSKCIKHLVTRHFDS